MNALRMMVFYDGSYFKQGNVYFRYKEERGWFSLPELHSVFERYVAECANAGADVVKVVAAHYYDGRATTNVTSPDALRKERDFEMSLIRAGVVPHYLAVRETPKPGASLDEPRFTLAQKGVDVQFAIDVLDYAHLDRFDVAVLVAGDEDFVPLVRRVESLGKHVLLACFDIDGWTDRTGKLHRPTFTSRALQDASTWCLDFNEFVKEPARRAAVSALFFTPQT
jgi:uncharacterized LabA/DUF88 family protein